MKMQDGQMIIVWGSKLIKTERRKKGNKSTGRKGEREESLKCLK